MGRFSHEANMIDPRTGYVYETRRRPLRLLQDGQTFTFAQNNINLTAAQITSAGKTIAPGNDTQAEWAGACYSPDGKWLFVNIQTPGITFAIKGPWGKGPL